MFVLVVIKTKQLVDVSHVCFKGSSKFFKNIGCHGGVQYFPRVLRLLLESKGVM